MHKMFSIAEVQTKVINCNSAIKSCLLQVMHTKAIAALTQFCDFFYSWDALQLANLCPNQSLLLTEVLLEVVDEGS